MEEATKKGFLKEFSQDLLVPGIDSVGSPIWADVREVEDDNLIPTADYSIYAHTRAKEPIITDRWANLDCRKAFLLLPGLKIVPVE